MNSYLLSPNTFKSNWFKDFVNVRHNEYFDTYHVIIPTFKNENIYQNKIEYHIYHDPFANKLAFKLEDNIVTITIPDPQKYTVETSL